MEVPPPAARPVLSRPLAALPPTGPATSPTMALLHAHVPLTLLLDLAWGVRSQEVYAREPADLSWLSDAAVA